MAFLLSDGKQMHPLFILLQLAGAILLLLWAVRMVRTGVERAWGAPLKERLRGAREHGAQAAFAGMIIAVLLQSSTAVGVLAAGFAANGILGVSSGIAALLGADLGSALVVKVLSFDLRVFVPVLIVAGAALYLRFEGRKPRQYGRIILGIAFILMALGMIGEATVPLRESPAIPPVMAYLSGDPLSAFALAAAGAWLMHSSVAALLLIVTFAARGMLPLDAAVPMVLGANLGGGIVAVWLTRGLGPVARRVPLGNLLFRGTAALLALGAVMAFSLPLERLGRTEMAQLVNFHIAFNFLLVLTCVPFAGAMARLTASMLPEPKPVAGLATRHRSNLDRSALGNPALALASVTRELLRMGEIAETMFRPVIDLLDKHDKTIATEILGLDREINKGQREIKLFVAEINRRELTGDEARRGMMLTDFAINLEHIGDLVAKNLVPLAGDMAARQLAFSQEGWTEITRMHDRVLSNMELAYNVLVSEDIESARQLVKEKERMRQLEKESQMRHLSRLGSGEVASIETSEIHLEIVRAFKEINSLLATVAYPILEETGELMGSRLAPHQGN